MRIPTLPAAVGRLNNLRGLYMSSSCLQAVPESLSWCGSLEECYLDNNYLATIPHSLLHLPRLQILSLAGNQLGNIPVTTLTLRSLCYLQPISRPLLPSPVPGYSWRTTRPSTTCPTSWDVSRPSWSTPTTPPGRPSPCPWPRTPWRESGTSGSPAVARLELTRPSLSLLSS